MKTPLQVGIRGKGTTHIAGYMPLVGDDAIKGQGEGARDECSRAQICQRLPRFNVR